MVYNRDKIFYYGTTGVIAAVMLIVLILSTPMMITFINPQVKTGTLLIKLTDAPGDLEELMVNITKIEAHSKDEAWIDLIFTEDQETGNPREWVWVDILKLQNVAINLSITELPPGNYTKLRLSINKASANFTGPEKELTPLTIPPGKIDIIIHFEIKTGKTTELIIDMQADWVAINEKHILRPVLKAKVYNQP